MDHQMWGLMLAIAQAVVDLEERFIFFQNEGKLFHYLSTGSK
jgi:hypothetical protein